MRRHSEIEHPQMSFETRGIDSARAKSGLEVGAAVKPLTASGHLDSAKQQIKACGVQTVFGRMGVEWPAAEREPGYE